MTNGLTSDNSPSHCLAPPARAHQDRSLPLLPGPTCLAPCADMVDPVEVPTEHGNGPVQDRESRARLLGQMHVQESHKSVLHFELKDLRAYVPERGEYLVGHHGGGVGLSV